MYLATISRVLPRPAAGQAYRDLTGLTREDVGLMAKDAFDCPLGAGQGGRPRADDGTRRVEFLARQVQTVERRNFASARQVPPACRGLAGASVERR